MTTLTVILHTSLLQVPDSSYAEKKDLQDGDVEAVDSGKSSELFPLRKRPLTQNKEKRKKSLPVRKLLELERGGGNTAEIPAKTSEKDVVGTGDRNSTGDTNSILGSLEKMVESKFSVSSASPVSASSLGLLQRLGIDEVEDCGGSDGRQSSSSSSVLQNFLRSEVMFGSFLAAERIKSAARSDDEDNHHPLEALRDMCTGDNKKKEIDADNDSRNDDREPSEEDKNGGDEAVTRRLRKRSRRSSDAGKKEEDEEAEKTPESKFLKYSELARQLSSR